MNLCDEENKKDEEYHDATEIADTSEAAGGRVAEKSTASADAEMTETEEQKEEASWTRAGGTRKKPIQADEPTKQEFVRGYMQIRANGPAAVKEALDELGATQTTPMEEEKWGWCYILHDGTKYKSYRSHRVRIENNAYVRRLR